MKMKICFIISFLLLSLDSKRLLFFLFCLIDHALGLCSSSSCVALNGGRGLFTDSTKTFSISVKAVEPDDQTVTIRMAARTAGWIAIGIGKQMNDSDLIGKLIIGQKQSLHL
jgi:hypothetical protein